MKAYDRISAMIYKMRDNGQLKQITNSDEHRAFVGELLTLRRLANKHHRLAEMDCNGVGVVRGSVYYSGMPFGDKPDAYEVREYGYGVKSAYMTKEAEETIFDIEQDKVRAKIEGICKRLGLRVEFQGDPRGYTVKVYSGDAFICVQD